jgi:hypothetical protein
MQGSVVHDLGLDWNVSHGLFNLIAKHAAYLFLHLLRMLYSELCCQFK